jgi:hypothetical protein
VLFYKGNQAQRIDEKELNDGDRSSIKPSEGSDLQVIEGSSAVEQHKVPDLIYRLGHSDKWTCKNCNIRDDKWCMLKHPQYCRGTKGQSKQIRR